MQLLDKRMDTLRDVLARKSIRATEVLLKVTCECLDPLPARRPTAMEVLSVCLKSSSSAAALQRSESFWKSLVEHPQHNDSELIAATTNRFISQYINLIDTPFSAQEVCLLMSLQATHSPSDILATATRLTKGFSCNGPGATVFHAAALATPKDAFIKALTWNTTKWPHNRFLSRLSLKKNKEGLLASALAASTGDFEVARLLMLVEYAPRNQGFLSCSS